MSFRKTISWVLFPLTVWYAVGVWLRNMMFSLGLKRQVAPPVTTIGVGNLCAGGAGKTPMVEYLLRKFSDQYETAFLSRGYRRKTTGFVLDDGSHSPSRVGDEPAMIGYKFPNLTVAVCEKRVAGVERLLARDLPPQLVVLDDVFQHRYIKPTINILLTEYDRPWFKDCIMPYGDLREFRSAYRRANIIVVTKAPQQIDPIERHNFVARLKLKSYQKVFFSHVEYRAPIPLMGGAPIPLSTIDHVLAVTGIANPQPMLQYLATQCKTTPLQFADHHRFGASDIKRMRKLFGQLEGSRKLILTTEKDAVRFRELKGTDLLAGLPIYSLPIEVCIHPASDGDFDHTIESVVSENVSFLDRMHKTKFNI